MWEEPAAVAGLVLAEVECTTDEELDGIVRPSWAANEVTEDVSYSAFNLARR